MFSTVPGYCKYEVIVDKSKSWQLTVDGHKGEVDLKWANMAEQIHTEYDLLQILAFIENSSTCSGVSLDKYSELITDKAIPVYHTRDGYPAAFVEIPKSELSLPLIRSSNCSILLPERSDVIDVPTTCKSCKLTENYLRTIKSRRNKTNESGSKFSTFESKSKEELIEIARQFSGRLKVLKQKVCRLNKHRDDNNDCR